MECNGCGVKSVLNTANELKKWIQITNIKESFERPSRSMEQAKVIPNQLLTYTH